MTNRMDNVLFTGTMNSCLEQFRWFNWHFLPKGTLHGMLNGSKQQIVGIMFIFEGQSAEADVIQIFEPFEEGNGDTAAVDEHVRNNQTIATLQQDSIGGRRCWSICSFRNNLNFKY